MEKNLIFVCYLELLRKQGLIEPNWADWKKVDKA